MRTGGTAKPRPPQSFREFTTDQARRTGSMIRNYIRTAVQRNCCECVLALNHNFRGVNAPELFGKFARHCRACSPRSFCLAPDGRAMRSAIPRI
jgi:hypothetical protein